VSSPPSKALLKDQLVRALTADLAVCERAYRAAREGATHQEAKPENDKDTRALEQSYLARGEALRLEDLRTALAEVQTMPVVDFDGAGPVRLGALVVTDEEGQAGLLWVAPHGGGTRLLDGAVQVVTPKSPLGRAILGANAGDECEVRLAGKSRIVSVVAVS
jgi:transcription elongation GreA/GreB family factor